MNLKINNELRSSTNLTSKGKKPENESCIKEERRRTGRYIAILVGISLFLLAIYHAWVRRIPIVASLVVPALIMFVYVGWVLYTASRDKHKMLDAEAALAAQEAEMEAANDAQNHLEISIIPNKDGPKTSHEDHEWSEISSALLKEVSKDDKVAFIKPVILVNDKPIDKPEDLDQKWSKIVESLVPNERLKAFQSRRKFKRKFCRRRRYAAFKRSYSIG